MPRYPEKFNTHLRKYYGLNDDARTFFTVHMVADKDHTAQSVKRIVRENA